MACSPNATITSYDLLTAADLHIVRGTVRTYLLTVTELVQVTPNGRIAEQRIDLTGASIKLTVRDKSTREVVLLKESSNIAQIEILPQVPVPPATTIATKGQALVKFLAVDTEAIAPGSCLEFDVWITMPVLDGRREAVIDTSQFVVEERVSDLP